MSKPVLYGPPFSTYVRTARLALEEKGVAYELRDLDMFAGAHTEPDYVKLNPFKRVPTLDHDGFVVYETRAITAYIDEAFEGPPLQPEAATARARMNQILGIMDSYLYRSAVTRIVVPRFSARIRGAEVDEDAVAKAIPEAKAGFTALDGLVADGEFLAGDALSLADLHLLPIYDYLRAVPESREILGDTGNLRRWWRAIKRRESVAATKPAMG